MHRPVKDPNKFLYHYTNTKTAVHHILANNSIRFSPYTSTNDPLERKNWYLNIFDGVEIALAKKQLHEKKEILQNLSSFYGLEEEIINKIKSKFKLICFTKDNKNQPPSPSLISGFLRGWGHPRMWAQYAENHKGVCLMFEKDKLDKTIIDNFGIEHIYQGDVKYSNEPIPDNIKKLNYHNLKKTEIEKAIELKITENLDIFFFQKATDWRDEHEFRWLITCDESADEFRSIPIDNSIRAIILGQETGLKAEKDLIGFSKTFRVQIYKIDWLNGNPMPNKSSYLPWVDEFPLPV